MAGIFINNPIAWAQIKARGGFGRVLMMVGGYIVLMAGIIYYTYQRTNSSMVLRSWSSGLLGIEMALAYFFGCTMISVAIRKDLTSGLMESHRLMPINSFSAIVGYMFGPTFNSLGVFLATVLLGAVVQKMAGFPIQDWLFCSGICAALGLFLWSFVVFTSFISKNAFGVVFGLVTGGFSSQGQLIEYLPGLNLTFSTVIGNSVFSILTRASWSGSALAWALIAQAVFSAIFLRAATRKYRRDDLPAFSVLLAILLLVTWVAVSWLGFRYEQHISFQSIFSRPRRGRFGPPAAVEDDFPIHLIVTIISSLIIGTLALYSAARGTTDYRRTLLATGVKPAKKPASVFMVAAIAPIIVMALFVDRAMFIDHLNSDKAILIRLLICTLIVAVTYFLSVGSLTRLAMKFDIKLPYVLGPYFLILWIVPLLIHSVLVANKSPYAKWNINSFSPGGLLHHAMDFEKKQYPLAAIGALIGTTIAILVISEMIIHRKPRPALQGV